MQDGPIGRNRQLFDRVALYGVPKIELSADVPDTDDMLVCSNGDGEAALAACTREIELYRKSGKGGTRSLLVSLLDRGTIYGAQGHYDLALRDFSEAIRLGSDIETSYNMRGQTYGMMGDYDRAIADFTRAIRLEPKFAAAMFNRGQTYRAKGEYDLAIDDFSDAIRINPDYAAAYRMRGSANHSLKKYYTAIDDFSKAIELVPDYPAALNGRALSYMAKQDYAHAVDDFDQAIRISPAYFEALHNRDVAVKTQICAGLRGSPGDRAKACLAVIAERLCPLKYSALSRRHRFPKHISARGRGSAGASKQQDLDRVLNDLSEAVRLMPQNAATAYRMRSAIYVRLGDADRALSDITRAIELNRSPANYVIRSLIYTGNGDSDRAIADMMPRSNSIRVLPIFMCCVEMVGL